MKLLDLDFTSSVATLDAGNHAISSISIYTVMPYCHFRIRNETAEDLIW